MSKKNNSTKPAKPAKPTETTEFKLNIYTHYAILEQENEILKNSISEYKATIVDLAKQVASLNKLVEHANTEYRMSDEYFKYRVEEAKKAFTHD